MHCCSVCLRNCGKPRNLVMASGLRSETGSCRTRSGVAVGVSHFPDGSKCYSNMYRGYCSKCYSNMYSGYCSEGPLLSYNNFADPIH